MWFATADLDGANVVGYFLLAASHNNLRLSPDGTKLLTDRYLESTEEEAWWVFDLAQGTVTQLPIPDDHGIVDVAWSGDSRFVSYLDMGDVAAGTEDRVVLLGPDGTEVSAYATSAAPSYGPPGLRDAMPATRRTW